MLKLWNRKPTTTQAIADTTAKLNRAYDQLADGNQVKTVAEFHAYGERWNVNTGKLACQAQANLDRVKSEALARQARRLNARKAIAA